MKFTLANAVSSLVLFISSPAMAASVEMALPKGEYALSKAECGSEIFAKLAPKRIDFLTYSCTKVTYDQTESSGGKISYDVKSPSCQGEEDTKAHADHFKLVLENDTLQVLWADGTKSGKAVLCKK